MPSVVNRKERFFSDIVAKITGDTSNVVRIVLEDGEIVGRDCGEQRRLVSSQ